MNFIEFVKIVRNYLFIELDEEKREKMKEKIRKAIEVWSKDGTLN